MPSDTDLISAEERAVLQALKAHIEDLIGPSKLWLFGSRARRDHRLTSDYDIVLVPGDDERAKAQIDALENEPLEAQLAEGLGFKPKLNIQLIPEERFFDAYFEHPFMQGFAVDGIPFEDLLQPPARVGDRPDKPEAKIMQNPVQVLFRPSAATNETPPADSMTDAHRELAERWRETLGLAELKESSKVDLEDWSENLATFFAAIDNGCEVHVFERSKEAPEVWSSTGAPAVPGMTTMALGRLRSHEPFLGEHGLGETPCEPFPGLVWPDRGSVEASLSYFANQGFIDNAGRQLCLADMPDEFDEAGGKTIYDACLEMRDAAPNRTIDIFAKVVCRHKLDPRPRFRLDPESTRHDVEQAFFEGLGFNLIELSGRKDAVLLQGEIEMRDEYRVLVVDGRPVAGAGCIEVFTPINRIPGSLGWDPQVASERNHSEIREDAETVARYKRDAARIAREVLAADPKCRDFILDLATARDGKTCVVELNPPMSFGTFAMDMKKAVGAMAQTTRQRHERALLDRSRGFADRTSEEKAPARASKIEALEL